MLIDRRAALAGLATFAASSGIRAQTAFPNHPIRLVVPFAPAGGTDIAARLLGENLATILGQNVVIDNRPGANGVIAVENVKASAADGYSLLVATAASFAGAPALGMKLPYDVTRDFTPVAMLGLFPLVLNVAPNLPVNSLADFIALVKKEPGKMNFASAGVGGTNHLVFELIAQATGIQLQHVPYRGAALAATDLMTGKVQAMVDSLAASLGNIQANKVKALAITTANRQPQVPNLATMKEQGVDLVYPGWASIVAPTRTPAPVITTLNAAINKAMAAPALKRRYEQLSIEPVAWSPKETGRFMAADRAALTELVRKTGIKVE